MGILKVFNDKILKFFDVVMFISSFLVCILIVISAIMRYILKIDFYGSEELILTTAFWMYFIGSAVATYEDSHIAADLIRTFLKNEVALKWHKVFKFAVSLFLFGILTIWSMNYIQFSLIKGQKTPVFKYPMVVSQASLLVSFGISCLYTVMHLVTSIMDLKHYLAHRKNKEAQV